MRFKIVGANSETGDDVDVVMEAASQTEVEKLAHERGILVSSIAAVPVPAHASQAPAAHPPTPAHATHAPAAHPPGTSHGTHAPGAAPPVTHTQKEKDFSSIALIDDEPAADGGDPKAPKHERARGVITVNANNPADTAHSGAGGINQGQHAETAMEYHILLNQSLFLLESAVNKHLRDGWEPTGGLAVGVINNAPQYFQSVMRKKKPAGAEAAPPAAAAAPAPPAAASN